MNRLFLLVTITFIAVINLSAQENFLLKNASKSYDVKIKVAKCENDTCDGAGTVYLHKKDQTKPFQTIQMSNIFLELGKDRRPTANLIELYGENNSGIVFDDYNFDGSEDLAIRNGNDGSYGGPSYDVYLYSKASGKFAKSPALTTLASENLGLFTVNKKTKTLETFNKSGCCWHQTNRYQIINNRPKKVYVFTEDATGNGDRVRLITETLVAGKWKKTVKSARMKDYYKEQ